MLLTGSVCAPRSDAAVMVGSWQQGWHLATSVLIVKGRGRPVARVGVVFVKESAVERRSPVANPPTSQAGCLETKSWTLNALLPASANLGTNRQSSFSFLENKDKDL